MFSIRPKFWSVCRIHVDGRDMIAGGSNRRRILLWDPVSGQNRIIGRPKRETLAMCEVKLDSQPLLASAGIDRQIRLWDPAIGRELVTYGGAHVATINALQAVPQADSDLLVSAGDEGVVLVLDLATRSAVRTLDAGGAPILDLVVFDLGGERGLASVGVDAVVRIWNLETGQLVHALEGHEGWVHAVCLVSVGNRRLIATAGTDGSIRLWDPVAGELVRALRPKDSIHTAGIALARGGTVFALCEVQVGGRTLLAAGGDFPGVWLWDPDQGRGVGWIGWAGAMDSKPACGWVRGLTTFPHPDGPALVTGGYDDTLQIFSVKNPVFHGF